MEYERIPDELQDTTPEPEPVIGDIPNAMELAPGVEPWTSPASPTLTATYTVAAETAATPLASTPAITIADENTTVTAVTYTPAGAQAAPTSGNSRTWTLSGNEGVIASHTFSSVSPALVSGTPVVFSISTSNLKVNEVLNFASTVVGSGVADPGGTLTVTYTF